MIFLHHRALSHIACLRHTLWVHISIFIRAFQLYWAIFFKHNINGACMRHFSSYVRAMVFLYRWVYTGAFPRYVKSLKKWYNTDKRAISKSISMRCYLPANTRAALKVMLTANEYLRVSFVSTLGSLLMIVLSSSLVPLLSKILLQYACWFLKPGYITKHQASCSNYGSLKF